MTLTKEQAMEKICPFRSTCDKVVRCAADECIMWEYYPKWYDENMNEVHAGYCAMKRV